MKTQIQTSMVGKSVKTGLSLDQLSEKLLPLSPEQRKAVPKSVVVHDRNAVYAGKAGTVVTVYQDGDKNIRYTLLIEGALVDFYSNEFEVLP